MAALIAWALAVVDIARRIQPEEDECCFTHYLLSLANALSKRSFATLMLVIEIDGNTYIRKKGEETYDVVVYMEGLNMNRASNATAEWVAYCRRIAR